MIETEDFAKANWWCSQARAGVVAEWETGTGMRDGKPNQEKMPVAGLNRGNAEAVKQSMCLGSGCGHWRWAPAKKGEGRQPRKGWCGLAGTPCFD